MRLELSFIAQVLIAHLLQHAVLWDSLSSTVRRNQYHHNAVGIFLMYSRDATIEHNVIKYSMGGTGVGIGMKESDNEGLSSHT